MKRLLSILISFTILFALSGNIYISALTEEDISENVLEVSQYEYNDDDIEILRQKELAADQMYESYKNMMNNQNISKIYEPIVYSPMPVTYTYTIPVTNYAQEKNNWCGAAVLKQTLSFHKSKSGSSTALPSQSTLASKLGISTSGGASSANMASVLNQYKSTFGYSDRTYSTADIADRADAFEWLCSRLKSEIVGQTYAPIVLLETGNANGISRYYNAGIHIRHYNTIGGIKEIVDIQYYYSQRNSNS